MLGFRKVHQKHGSIFHYWWSTFNGCLKPTLQPSRPIMPKWHEFIHISVRFDQEHRIWFWFGKNVKHISKYPFRNYNYKIEIHWRHLKERQDLLISPPKFFSIEAGVGYFKSLSLSFSSKNKCNCTSHIKIFCNIFLNSLDQL